MPNVYESKLAKVFRFFFAKKGSEYAVTLGQTAYFSCSRDRAFSNREWIEHEERHKMQWRRDGWKFLPKYLWYQLRYGYQNNPYEIDAREYAKKLS